MNTEKPNFSGIISLTKGGDGLGEATLQKMHLAMPNMQITHFDSQTIKASGGIKPFLADNFQSAQHWIFIGAVGIMIRAMAPLLRDKFTDPAVLAMDEAGQYVISLLSGHAGGANELAKAVAALTGANAVITTATDVLGVASLDLVLQKLKVRLKDYRTLILKANTALTRSQHIGIWVDQDYLNLMGLTQADWQPQVPGLISYQDGASLKDADLGLKIYVGVNPLIVKTFQNSDVEVVIPRPFVLGTGAKKQLPTDQYIEVLSQWLDEMGICMEAIDCAVSITLKSSEVCILETAQRYGWQCQFYDVVALMPYEDAFESSSWVKSTTGIGSVSGPAVLKAIGGNREGLLGKTFKGNGCTFTLGRISHD